MFSLCMQSVALHEATADGAEPRCSCGFAMYPSPVWWMFLLPPDICKLQTSTGARKLHFHNNLRMILKSRCERFSTAHMPIPT